MRRLGVHTSITGGIQKSLERAKELGCNTLQIFSHNPRGWAVKARDEDECESFKEFKQKHDIAPAFIHASYLINLAAVDKGLLNKSVSMVIEELNIADSIGAEYVVLHTGSASGDDPASARKRAFECLRQVEGSGRWSAGLLLENTAGERGDITSRVREIAEIMHNVPGRLISGICLDTCHAFAAGYELRTYKGTDLLASEIETLVGKNKLRLIHLNDSKGGAGSGVDRHEHIGEGNIGAEAIRYLINHPLFKDTPLILETPKKTEEDDMRNLGLVKTFLK